MGGGGGGGSLFVAFTVFAVSAPKVGVAMGQRGTEVAKDDERIGMCNLLWLDEASDFSP